MYVPLSDLRQAVRLVDGLNDLGDPADFAELALPGLARLIGTDSLSYNEIGPGPGQVAVISYPHGAATPDSLAAFAAFVHEHPLINHYRRTGDDRPVMISDFLTRQRFHRLGLYADVFCHIPIECQIAFSLPLPGSAVIGIALNRADGDFTEKDRALLDVIRGSLSSGLRRARRRKLTRESLAVAESSPLGALTEREEHVLRLAALGRTNTAIAHALDVSPRTVAKHLEHIYRKLGVTSRVSAVLVGLTSQA